MKGRMLVASVIPLASIMVLFMMMVVSSASAAQTYEVLSPWGDRKPVTYRGVSPRLDGLNKKVIGLFANSKPAAKPVLTAVEKKLKETYPGVQFSWYKPKKALRYNFLQNESVNKKTFNDWLSKVDGVIAASADCGSCTKYLVYESIIMEDEKKPVAALADKDFAKDARSAASGMGLPGLRIVKASISSSRKNMDDHAAGIEPYIDDIVLALTKPLTDDEKAPKQKEVKESPRIVFSGSINEVNQQFYKRGWSDGLPIVPPTEEAVAEMLTGTDLPPDHVVAAMIPRRGEATVEKIAINAVMAGALPTYMPVLIAFVKALDDKELNFGTWEVSTGSWVPFWVINGPIRKDLHLNSGSGALSPGDIANAAIGRAIGLIIKNIGGARKGIEDMGTLGNPGKYSCVLAENEEKNPWEPLHVENGLKKEDSTVSVSFPNCFLQGTIYNLDAKGLLSTLVYNTTDSMPKTWLLTPKMAKTLSDAGYSKADVKNYVMQHATTPYNHTRAYGRKFTSAEKARRALFAPINPTDPVHILKKYDQIQIVVAGGPGNFMGMLGGGAGNKKITTPVKIELPANWKKLVEKYKNLVPHYEEY